MNSNKEHTRNNNHDGLCYLGGAQESMVIFGFSLTVFFAFVRYLLLNGFFKGIIYHLAIFSFFLNHQALGHDDEDLHFEVDHHSKPHFTSVSCLVKGVNNLSYEKFKSSKVILGKGDRLWVYTDINQWTGENDHTIKHSWYKENTLVNKIVRDVDKGHVMFSYLTIDENREGNWKVIVRDKFGNPVEKVIFKITKIEDKYQVVFDPSLLSSCDQPQKELISDTKANSWLNFDFSPSYYYQTDDFEYLSFRFAWISKRFYFARHFGMYFRLGGAPLEYESGKSFWDIYGDLLFRIPFGIVGDTGYFDIGVGGSHWDGTTNLKYIASLSWDVALPVFNELGLEYNAIMDSRETAHVASLVFRLNL